MGLCGSFRCGCGVTSTPAVEGAIDGELPSIYVTGSGEAGDPYDLSLNDVWAALVADSINGLEWTSFVPTWNDLTVGDAVPVFYKRYVGPDHMDIIGTLTLGAGSSVGAGGVTMNIPDGRASLTAMSSATVIGNATYGDAGTTTYAGFVRLSSVSTSRFALLVGDAAATYLRMNSTISTSIPHTWASPDTISINVRIPLQPV